MTILSEGLRRGDLADIVLPLISVDEYDSKISDEAIVFGFFVNDRDAANDLNRFIQKSPYALLDTDVSPAPDAHGYYLVFVEVLRNSDAPKVMSDIASEVSDLTDIKNWSMRVYGDDKTRTFSEDSLAKILEDEKESLVSETAEFIAENSQIIGMQVNGSRLRFSAILGENYVFEISDAARIDESSALCMEPRTVAYCHRLQKVLGEGWSVNRLGEHTVLEFGERTIILK